MARRAPRKAVNGADFLTAAKAAGRREKIDIEGVEFDAYARTMSAAEHRRLGEASLKPGGKPGNRADYDDDALTQYVIAACVVDAEGARLIPEGREAELEDLPSQVRAALQKAVLRVNGMDAGDAKDDGGDKEPAGNV